MAQDANSDNSHLNRCPLLFIFANGSVTSANKVLIFQRSGWAPICVRLYCYENAALCYVYTFFFPFCPFHLCCLCCLYVFACVLFKSNYMLLIYLYRVSRDSLLALDLCSFYYFEKLHSVGIRVISFVVFGLFYFNFSVHLPFHILFWNFHSHANIFHATNSNERTLHKCNRNGLAIGRQKQKEMELKFVNLLKNVHM